MGVAPILLGLGAAFIWGGADFAGGLAARRAPAVWVVLIAHGSSVVALAGLILLLHPVSLARSAWPVALLSGITGGVGLMFFYRALASDAMGLSAAVAGIITAAVPVAVAFFQQGRPGSWQLAGFLAAGIAIALIAWSPGEATRARTVAMSVAAGIGFGTQLVLLHAAAEHGSSLRALMVSRVGGVAVAGLAVTWTQLSQRNRSARIHYLTAQPQPTFSGSVAAFLLLSLLTGLLDTTGNGLYMASALIGRLDVAAVLSSLYPGSTILLAAWLLNERTTRLQSLGMALALVAVALISA